MNDEAPPVLNPAPPPRRGAWSWWIFLAALLAPAVIMALVARYSSDAQSVVLFVGGGASALFCGIWLARRLFPGRWTSLQVLMAFVFTIVLFSVNVVLCCVGCTLGGGKFDVR